jgi:hypothetical protein|nr:MAG TPA: hypothetical protein [Caudoviricetes sp.]DAO47595.1 MAG TPA: hypothetical protein [Caudoviricetes sp.]DAQ29647.1 MAG TPA: hypothetical protein [Caudoviricetes sp.]
MNGLLKQIVSSFKRVVDFLSMNDESAISQEGKEILSDPEKKKIFLNAVEKADQKRKEENSTELIKTELQFSDGNMTVLI